MTTLMALEVPRNLEAGRLHRQCDGVSQASLSEKALASKRDQQKSLFDNEFQAAVAVIDAEVPSKSSGERRSKVTADAEMNGDREAQTEESGVIEPELTYPKQVILQMPLTITSPVLNALPTAPPASESSVSDVLSMALKGKPNSEEVQQVQSAAAKNEIIVPSDTLNTVELGEPFRQVRQPGHDHGESGAQRTATAEVTVLSVRSHWAATGPAQAFAKDLTALTTSNQSRIQMQGENVSASKTSPLAWNVEHAEDRLADVSHTNPENLGQHRGGDDANSPSHDEPAFERRSTERSSAVSSVPRSESPAALAPMAASFASLTAAIGNEMRAASLEPAVVTQAPVSLPPVRPEIVRNMQLIIDPGAHGPVGLHMSLNSDGLDLRVETSNADTAHLLNSAANGLHASLCDVGLEISSVSVQVTNELSKPLAVALPNSDERGNPGQPSAGLGQPPSSGGGRGANASGGEGNAWKGRPNSPEPMANINSETTTHVSLMGSRTLFV
ncbi:MAG: flagellar hook-length control protein FliK [Hyphomicrobium sp.]